MADQAVDVIHKTRASDRQSGPITNAVTLYEGALVGFQGGYVNHFANGATDVFAGICLGPGIGIDPGAALLGATSSTPIPEVRIDTSGVTLMHLASVDGTPSQAKVGNVVYAHSSNVEDLDLTADTTIYEPVGWLSYFRSTTDVDVTLFSASEYIIYVGL